MKKYTIFYHENGNYYQIYVQNGKYWLGGSRVEWLLFYKKAEAERVLKDIEKQNSPHFEKGSLKVERCWLQPFG